MMAQNSGTPEIKKNTEGLIAFNLSVSEFKTRLGLDPERKDDHKIYQFLMV
jgi:hypothetical protein